MARILLTVILIICSVRVFGQAKPSPKSLAEYFTDVSKVTSRNRSIWNTDLYGPILFVDPQSRDLYSNERDSAGVLTQESGLFIGKLPKDVNIANTSIRWNGNRWAMILLPLSDNRNERLALITHELFHLAQPVLKFKSVDADNNHLDKKLGRTYLRLELEALQKAVKSPGREGITHIINALRFRKLRHQIFPDADSTENLLELNEGLAEYTGLIMSERTPEQITEHLVNNFDVFQQNKTFVRSFAYQTIPVYGYLTRKLVKEKWNQDITMKTNLTDYFIASFKVNIPSNLETYASRASVNYNGEQIKQEEEQREANNIKLINEMTLKFIKNPHLEIAFERMNVSFNPSNLIPLENYGTVYPTLRITDNWGILTVEDGALMSADWSKVIVTVPVEDNNNGLVKGKGWTLELKVDRYLIVRDEASSNYYLRKK
ncbi:MAG TPA: hypothetical protein VK589_03450 [Chryseolinea sp.]|nr:hypothetical protein [Chryseolinea sp.]